MPGAGEIGAFRHHQAASLCPGHIKLFGDGRNGTVRGLAPDDHLRELGVDAVHKALLVCPAPITESLVVRGPGAGEHLGDSFLIDGLHGPAHAQPLLQFKGRVIVAALIHLAGGGIHIVQLVGV